MMESRSNLPPLPARMKKLPLDHRGFPVPWFVAVIDGKPDFRVVDTPKIGIAVKQRRCWVCGDQLGVHMAFIIGPMCAVNRVISEPPSHRDCAVFSATACPFLTQPKMRRNEKDLPADVEEPAGFGLKRNPGAACVWITRSYKPFRAYAGQAGILFQLGEPEEVLWFANGRTATRSEVMESIEIGLPLLRAEEEGPEAVIALQSMLSRAMRLIPA